MARVNRVQKSNKPHVCEVGGHEIPKGDPYLWAKPGFRTRRPRVRCIHHPFKPSDLATGLNAAPMAAQEEFDEGLSKLEEHDYEGLNALVSEFRDALEEYRDERQQGLDAWENGNSMLEDLLDQAEEALNELEAVEEFEEYDEDEPEEPTRDQFEEGEEGDTDYDEAYSEWESEHESWEEARAEHWQNAIDAASEASAAVSL